MQIQYVKVRESGLIFPVEDAFKNTYRVPVNEYREISKSCCTPVQIMEVQEGQHQITTEQLQELKDIALKGDMLYGLDTLKDKLQAWFPAVLAPAKATYHVGQQFANKDFPSVSYEIVQFIDNRVGILCNDDSLWAGTDGRQLHRVNDPQAITQEEFEQIIGPNSVRDKSLTLLPDTTDQMV